MEAIRNVIKEIGQRGKRKSEVIEMNRKNDIRSKVSQKAGKKKSGSLY